MCTDDFFRLEKVVNIRAGLNHLECADGRCGIIIFICVAHACNKMDKIIFSSRGAGMIS